jgi:hypothetical protein
MQERIATVRSKKLSIRGLTTYTSMTLLGRGFAHVPALEERLTCSLDADLQRRVLTAWAHPDDASRVEVELTRLVREVREGALEQVGEEPLLGGARAVFGCGGAVQRLLFGEACITVLVNGLPRDFAARTLRGIAETWGAVRSCEVRACTRDALAWGKVVYFEPDDATRAVEGLQGACVGDPPVVLSTSPGGVRMPAMVLADKATGSTCTRNSNTQPHGHLRPGSE